MQDYYELKNLVDTAEPDIIKAMDGNLQAGKRARTSLRGIVAKAKEIRDKTMEIKKTYDANKGKK